MGCGNPPTPARRVLSRHVACNDEVKTAMSMEWVRNNYGVPAKRGGPVEYTGRGKPELGTIRSASGSYLMIQIDGVKHARPFHQQGGSFAFGLRFMLNLVTQIKLENQHVRTVFRSWRCPARCGAAPRSRLQMGRAHTGDAHPPKPH